MKKNHENEMNDSLAATHPRLSYTRIQEALNVINPVFLHTPQFVADQLCRDLNLNLLLKVETLNPIRSFKGRGADFFLSKLSKDTKELVCASVGNFGQGMAYVSRSQARNLTVFSAENANPLKIKSMKAFGANVIQKGADFDAAKAAAIDYAQQHHAFFVEDGKDPSISEGAGTIAIELLSYSCSIDVVVIPIGNGALINGIGTYFKHFSPKTKIIGVVAAGAPCMLLSWQQNQVIETKSMSTFADGIAVRVPVPEALLDMRPLVDDMLMVNDESIKNAMKRLLFELGLVVEPGGAAGVAAILDNPSRFCGMTVATILTGGNITQDQMLAWFFEQKGK